MQTESVQYIVLNHNSSKIFSPCRLALLVENYRKLYKYLKKQYCGNNMQTFVFPDWVCVRMRERFGSCGAYDNQYNKRTDVYVVTEEDLVCTVWEHPPNDCDFCNQSMPDTQ
jgi:hypothetical protein